MKKYAGAKSPYFYPGEPLVEGNMRVTVLGSGTPLPRRGQASPCILVEAGEDLMLLDVGPGGPANLTSLEIPLIDADKVFITHHHVDHIGALDQSYGLPVGHMVGRRRFVCGGHPGQRR
jgi:ribonuclease Z